MCTCLLLELYEVWKETIFAFTDLKEKFENGELDIDQAYIAAVRRLNAKPINLFDLADSTKDIIEQLRAIQMRMPVWKVAIQEGKIDIRGHGHFIFGEVKHSIEALEEFGASLDRQLWIELDNE